MEPFVDPGLRQSQVQGLAFEGTDTPSASASVKGKEHYVPEAKSKSRPRGCQEVSTPVLAAPTSTLNSDKKSRGSGASLTDAAHLQPMSPGSRRSPRSNSSNSNSSGSSSTKQTSAMLGNAQNLSHKKSSRGMSSEGAVAGAGRGGGSVLSGEVC